jgi:hypothetical protein
MGKRNDQERSARREAFFKEHGFFTVKVKNDLSELQTIVGEWSLETFPDSTPEGHTRHMAREVQEIMEAVESGDIQGVAHECGGLLVMLLGMAHRLEFDLFTQAAILMPQLMARRWCPADKDGIIEHDRNIPDIYEKGEGSTFGGLPKSEAALQYNWQKIRAGK